MSLIELQKEQQEFNIEEWFDLIKDYTFETDFVKLSIEDAEKMQETQRPSEKTCVALQASMKKMAGDGGGTFVKLSCRSAKDASVHDSTLKSAFCAMCRARQVEPADENGRLFCLLQAATELLKMTECDVVLKSFINSERIAADLRMAMNVYRETSQWNINFAVRTWHHLEIDMEFRAFVYKGRLNAISQYNHMLFSARLVEHKEHVLDVLTSSWSKVRENLKDSQFSENIVIDFGITDFRSNDERVWVVELNPFLDSTSGGMFSWRHDEKILKNLDENCPIDFRLNKKYSPSIKADLMPEWKDFLVNKTMKW